MVPSPDVSLLNEYQRQRLGIVLGHLQRACGDIAHQVGSPAPAQGIVIEDDDLPDRFRPEGPRLLRRANCLIAKLAETFDLPVRHQSRQRWIRSVLSLGYNDLYEVRASGLHGYGNVHPSLATVLDPKLAELQQVLHALLGLVTSDQETGP